MVNLPKLKKKVHAFLVGEEGKISKESLIKAGAFVGMIAVSGAIAANNASASISHANNLGLSVSSSTATGTHTHHASHSSY